MLTVAYDGTNYCGWQIQPNGNTIEAELNRHLSALLGEEIRVIGASRTDSGVHALGNVAVFSTQARMPAGRISFALNTRLPADIRIQDSREVPQTFHPRRCSTVKTYEYRIWNHRFPNPLERLYALHYYYDLDLDRMRQAAGALVGTHDFTGFCTISPDQLDRVRTIYSAEVEQTGSLITIRVTGNGFLYHMVRIIAGTLIAVGGGLREPEIVTRILSSGDRSLAGDTAAPYGLRLVSIRYPEEVLRTVI